MAETWAELACDCGPESYAAFINCVVKPFSMVLLAWAFFRVVFAAFITMAEADQYVAGCIILAAAPCTAMVFVWSHLTNGDAAYTLVQVSVNDLIMLVLFVPIVQFLVHGASSLVVPFSIKDIQAHLRHAQPNVTAEIYMQAIPESVRRAVETLDKLLIAKHPDQTSNDSAQN
jgi:predicted Na+-dependent transporter